ncbi:MAG: T9SS type A sorting domain-containing protein [Ignavibacteria bacterium]
MKTFIGVSLIIIICFSGNKNYAQWEADYRLTNNPSTSITAYDNTWCVAANGNFVHAAWYDYRDGNPEIYYKRSTNYGVSWGADTRLTTSSFDSFKGNISTSGSVVHLVWYELQAGHNVILYKRSTDDGATWGSATIISGAIVGSTDAMVASSGSNVYAVWEALLAIDNREIYLARSTDGGLSWLAPVRITNAIGASQNPAVSASGQDVHLIWDDGGFYINVFYLRSTNAGANWSAQTQLSNSTGASFSSVSCTGQNVNASWLDGRDGHTEIYYKRSTNAGMNWSTDTRLTNDLGIKQPPVICSADSSVHVVWFDQRDGNMEIYYKRSTNLGLNWDGDFRLTNDAAASRGPGVAASGTNVHVVWYDSRAGNTEIYYKRNPTGNPISVNNISTEITTDFALFQNYPNPFNPVTDIKFSLPNRGLVNIVVYDVNGRITATLVNSELNAGTYNVDFDASELASGIYFYSLSAGNFVQTKKMLIIK